MLPFQSLLNPVRSVRYYARKYRFSITLFLMSGALHLFVATTLGAKFWWDTIAYFELAGSITNLDSLHALYEGPFGVVYQHLMPGLPLFIAIFEKLFGGGMWPAFAITQNLLDTAACVYFATSFSNHIGRSSQVALVVLAALFPYFSAFHNAILTESLTSSAVLFMTGTALRCLEGRLDVKRALIVLLSLAVVGGQLRSYILLIGAGFSVLVAFSSHGLTRPWVYAGIVTTVLVGVLAFPVYRMAAGIEFFLPRVDALMVMHANYVNWSFNERSRQALDGVVLDPGIRNKLDRPNGDVGLPDVIKMVDDLVASGKSRAEAITMIGNAGRVLRTQSWEVIERQLQLSLSSLGFQRLATCCDPSRVLMNGDFTGERMLSHLRYYYIWNSGLGANYTDQFWAFERRYRDIRYFESGPIDWYTGRVGPYVKAQPTAWRDFLKLSVISPDLLIALGLAGIAMIVRLQWRLAFLFGLPIFAVYVAALSATVVGDNRHAHLLWPFYILGVVAVLERLIRMFPTPAAATGLAFVRRLAGLASVNRRQPPTGRET